MSVAESYPSQDQLNNDIVDGLYKIFPVRVIVAGSRTYNNYPEFKKILQEYLEQHQARVLLYSGMALKGADKLAIDFSMQSGGKYLYYPFPAAWKEQGRGAGMIRNRAMAETATHLIAFYDGASRGTKDMIEVAKSKGLHVTVIDVKPDQEDAVKIFTIQMAQWRLAKTLNIKFLDITFKSGIQVFAPDASNVVAYKNGELSEEDYTSRYIRKMGDSRVLFPNYWKRLLSFKSMALACYCAPGKFCHRHLFAEMVGDYLEVNDVESIICGELLPH